MLKPSAETASRIFLVSAAAVAALMAANMLILATPTITLPTSDYVSVFNRYLDYQEGKIGFLSYILAKHVDHNHAFAYLLSLIDIRFDNGQLRLLHWTQIIAHVAVAVLLGWLVLQLKEPISVKAVMLLFVAGQIFAIDSAEVWIFPFQVVLASFRFFLVAGLLLYCRELMAPQPNGLTLSGALLVLLVAALSHGAGIVVFALLFALCGLRTNRKVIYYSAAMFVVFILHEVLFPSATPVVALLGNISSNELWKAPYYLTFLLGNSFAWGAPVQIKVLAGTAGIVVLSVLVVKGIRKIRREPTEISYCIIFFVALSVFSLIAAFLSVLLNLSYMEFREVAAVEPDYFLASRYLVTTAGFWIGLSVGGLMSITRGRLFISLLLLCSSGAAVWYGETQKGLWKVTLERHKWGELMVSNDSWEDLDPASLKDMLFLPVSFPLETVREVLHAQREHQLGPYVPELVEKNRRTLLNRPINLTDVNWQKGVARNWSGFVVINVPEHRSALLKGTDVELASGETRRIAALVESGIYLNVFLEGSPLDAEKAGFPGRIEVLE